MSRLSAAQEGLPERENHEVLAQFLFCGLTNLANALLGDAKLAGEVVERGVFQVVAANDARVIRRKPIECRVDGRVSVDRFGRLRRAGGVNVNERVEPFTVCVGFIRRAHLRTSREAFEFHHGIRREPGSRGDLARDRHTAEFAFEHSG